MYGEYFAREGAQKFADALKDFIEKHNGKVLLSHKIDKILVRNGKIWGVQVGNKVFKVPIVVANAEAVIISSIICANDICNWNRLFFTYCSVY